MSLSKEEWAAHVLSYDVESCNMRGYCREKGIPYQSFRYWFKRLRTDLVSNGDQLKENKGCFLPIHLKNQNMKTKGHLRLKLNGITIVVGSDGFCPDLLRETLSVIRSCEC